MSKGSWTRPGSHKRYGTHHDFIFQKKIQLITRDGQLHTPFSALRSEEAREHFTYADLGEEVKEQDPLLMVVYAAGDCDTIRWPDYNPDKLREALYGAREKELIPDHPGVLLPDGTLFMIDQPQ